jgi:hypothetical protein
MNWTCSMNCETYTTFSLQGLKGRDWFGDLDIERLTSQGIPCCMEFVC